MPPEIEWFANTDNPRTRRDYMIDLRDFMAFVGIGRIHGKSGKLRYLPLHPGTAELQALGKDKLGVGRPVTVFPCLSVLRRVVPLLGLL